MGLGKEISELTNTKETEIYDLEGNAKGTFELAVAPEAIDGSEKVGYVITGGVISQRLVDICHRKGVKAIYGYKRGHITKKPESIKVVPMEEA